MKFNFYVHDYVFTFDFVNKGFKLYHKFNVVGSSFSEGNLYKLCLDAFFSNSFLSINVNEIPRKSGTKGVLKMTYNQDCGITV